MAAPLAAAATAPAAGAAKGAAAGAGWRFAGDLFTGALANMITGGLAPGGPVVPMQTTPSQVKYNLTSADVQSYVQMADRLNRLRRLENTLFGSQLPMVTPEELISNEVETNRLLMKEAGEREYAIEQLRMQGGIQQALANQIGTALQAQSGATQQMIASTLQRRSIDPQDAELARAF